MKSRPVRSGGSGAPQTAAPAFFDAAVMTVTSRSMTIQPHSRFARHDQPREAARPQPQQTPHLPTHPPPAPSRSSPGWPRRARPACDGRSSPRPQARTTADDATGVALPPTGSPPPAPSRSRGAPVPRPVPASRLPCWTAAPRPTHPSAPCGPHTGAAAPPRHARPASSRQPPRTADGPTLSSRPPERSLALCSGYGLDTRILAGQRHLSAIWASDRLIPLNSRG